MSQSLKLWGSCRMKDTEVTYPLISLCRHRIMTDGDGVTTLLGGAFCPLACRYCLNREVLQKPFQNVTPRQLYDIVKKDSLYFEATGGGVTFGGGESLLHTAFISEFRKLCGNKWHIYAETCLNVPTEAVLIAEKCIDRFIVDIKTLNPDTYLAYTGHCQGKLKENLRQLLSKAGSERILVRVPLIPGFTEEKDQAADAQVLRDMGFEHIDCFTYITDNV